MLHSLIMEGQMGCVYDSKSQSASFRVWGPHIDKVWVHVTQGDRKEPMKHVGQDVWECIVSASLLALPTALSPGRVRNVG